MKALAILFLVFLLSCVKVDSSSIKHYADKFDYTPYNGRTVDHIVYEKYGGTAGDVLHIHFKDGGCLDVYAYKYTMEILK